MTIDTWMGTLKTNLAAVSGIRQVHKYNELPGSIVTFPTIIIMPVSGDQTISAGGLNIAHHQVQVNLYLAAQVLPEAYYQAIPFINSIRAAIAADITLGNLVAHCLPVSPPEQWYTGPGALKYGDKDHVGIIFRLDVKEQESITVLAVDYDYYVDSVSGSDSNTGTSITQPLASLTALMELLSTGDSIGLKRGSTWDEPLVDAANYTVGIYGTGADPVYYTRADTLIDDFSTAAAAPLTSPRTCDPGPGTITLIQADGEFYTTEGKVITPAPALGFGYNALYTAAQTRAAGLGIIFEGYQPQIIQVNSLGWDNAIPGAGAYRRQAWYHVSTALSVYIAGTSLQVGSVQSGGYYNLGVILRSAGAFFLAGGTGITEDAELLWVDDAENTASLYAGINNYNQIGVLSSFSLRQFSRWATDANIYTSLNAAPSTGTTYNHTANGLVEFTWTVGSSETLELDFRRTDDDNRWIVRCNQAAGTIALIERNASTETSRANDTQTWTPASNYRIVVQFNSTTIRMYVANVQKGTTYTSASLNSTATAGKVAGFASGSNLIAWPRTVACPFSSTITRKYYLGLGDSKTFVNTVGFQPYLNHRLNKTDSSQWSEQLDDPIAESGWRVLDHYLYIDDTLAARSSSPTPDYILANLGANDVVSMPVEATWKTQYKYVLDALNTKWPNADIYIMRPWRRDYGTECNTIAAWIADIVADASYSGFCHLGPDERVFLENGDDGATYTSDGAHPTAEGYDLMASEWVTVLGL